MPEFVKPAAIVGFPALIAGSVYASYRVVSDLPSEIYSQKDPISKIKNAYELFNLCRATFPNGTMPRFCEYTFLPTISLNFAEASIVTLIVGIIAYRIFSQNKKSHLKYS